jgi:molybdate transport system substrate-binding protein
MTQRFLAAAVGMAVVVTSALSSAGGADAAEIKLISAPGVRGAVTELVRQFEAATGHEVIVHVEVLAALARRVDAGEAFDVAILSPAMIDDLARSGRVVSETRATFGRGGIGIAVRKGAPRPDVGSVEAFKQAMLKARSVAYGREGRSSKIFLAALERAGIVGELRSNMKAVGSTLQAVAEGEAELAVTAVGAILADSRVDLAGALPPELQSYSVYALGASTTAKQPEDARALIRFLTAPEVAAVLRTYGMEPGTAP